MYDQLFRFEAGGHAKPGMREGSNLEKLTHGAPIMTDQPFKRRIDFTAVCALGSQGRSAVLDAETSQELRLLDRPEADCAHGLDRSGQRLKIYMSSQVQAAGGRKRICIGMLTNSLQGLPKARFGMTIVDHECGASIVCGAPPKFHCRSVGAPFKNRAGPRRTQRSR